MDLVECSARSPDGQTRCTALVRSSSRFCKTHNREQKRSLEDYKATATRAEELRHLATTSQKDAQGLHSLQDIGDAVKRTEEYLDALKEEARKRVAHSRQFFPDDPPEGHHKRVDVLLQKIESCTVIVSQLRERRVEKEAERLSTDGRQRIEPEARPRRAFTRPDATPAWAPPSQPRPYQRPSPQHGWNCAPPDAAQWRGRNMEPEDGRSSGYTFTQVIIVALVGYGAYKLARYGGNKLVDYVADRIVSLLRSRFDLTELTGWVHKSLSTANEQLPPLVERPLVPADALKGAEGWIRSNVESVGNAVSQLVSDHAPAAEAVVQTVAKDAQKLAENAAGEAQKFAQNAAGEAQKVAQNAAQDVGQWVQEGLKSDTFKDLAGSFGFKK
ncbi:hypothetical protein C8Q76DRAFT_795350 [Earliella scabrosa]|nr:hypothetical protein C8Q76DRAFT_795350 [Earliella scabrosa]